MNLWLESHPKPLVIGHRGASAHAPENTLAAFRLAREQGADGIEFDVKRCATGEVVIMHDATVDRTTNGRGNVHQLSLAELRRLDAGNGEHVPLLDEVFEELGGRDHPTFLFNVEVTNYQTRGDGLEAAVIEVVRRHNIASRVLFSSFNPLSVHLLSRLAPEIPRAILYAPNMPRYLREVWLGPIVAHEFRHPHFSMVTAEMVEALRNRFLRVNAWTVNEPDDIARMIACGVAGIIGDSPRTILDERFSIAANAPLAGASPKSTL
ncbi:MAG: glycerophosphodiester phosphodiesterase [Anaerolineae bacterium]